MCADSPRAGRAAGRRVRRQLTAEPVSVEVGRRVVRAQTLAVTLTDLGQDVDPVARLHAVIGLDVERPLRLDDLEHLQEKQKAQLLQSHNHFTDVHETHHM